MKSPPEHERVLLVEEVSHALQASVDYEAVIGVALDAIVPRLADLAVLVLQNDSDPTRIEVSHSRPSMAQRLRRDVVANLDHIREAACAHAREGRYARWVPTVNDTAIRLLSRRDPALVQLLDAFDLRSFIVVALRAGGRTIGGLALGRCEESEAFLSGDFAMVQVLSRRIALAMESAMVQEQLEREIARRSGLGEAMHRWIQVFDLAWWGAAVVDGYDHRIDMVNPAFARLHGYRLPSDLSGHLFAEVLPPDRTAEPDQWSAESKGRTYETIHQRTDGTTFPVLVSATPLNDGDKPKSYVVTVQDLTDLKRTEERLQRAQRMEAVGRLAGGVAHEVNNMMTIILGFSDLLTRDLEQGHVARREVDEIRKAAMRAAKITTQLLAFSRQQVLQPVDLPLNEVVEEMVPVLRLMLPANVRVETGAVADPRSW